MRLLRPRRRQLLALAGALSVQALPAAVGGTAVAHAIDQGFLPGRPTVGFAWLSALAVAAGLGAVATRAVYLQLGAVVEPVRDELVREAVGGALRRSTRSGSSTMPDAAAVAAVTSHAEAARDTLAGLVLAAIAFPVTAIATLAGLATLAPAVLWFVVPPLVVALGLLLATSRSLGERQRQILLADERLAHQTTRYLGGLRDVTACGGEARALARLGREVDAHFDATSAITGLTAIRTATLGCAQWIPVVLLVLATPWLTRRGMTAGEVLGCFAYLLQGLHQALATLVAGLTGSGSRTAAILRRAVETADPPAPVPVPAAPARPGGGGVEVCLQGVTFAYGPHSAPVLRDLDVRVPAGDHLAVVGPSGIGKSTLAGLVAGSLRPGAGHVRIDGVAAHDVPPPSRVLIPQESYVFAGTLGDNLRYYRPDATPAMLDEAVAAVGLRALADVLGGYDAPISSATLDSGEQQLVVLARTYLSPARLVVLDEATCHLDPVGEAVAEAALADRGGTLIVIAHRISSAIRARRVLVLDGTSAEIGTHQALVRSSPLYRDLVGYWHGGDAGAT